MEGDGARALTKLGSFGLTSKPPTGRLSTPGEHLKSTVMRSFASSGGAVLPPELVRWWWKEIWRVLSGAFDNGGGVFGGGCHARHRGQQRVFLVVTVAGDHKRLDDAE